MSNLILKPIGISEVAQQIFIEQMNSGDLISSNNKNILCK